MNQIVIAAICLCACAGPAAPPHQHQQQHQQHQQQSPSPVEPPVVVVDQPGVGANCPVRAWAADACRDHKQCQHGCRAPVDAPVEYGDCTCPAGEVCYARWTGMGRKDWCAAGCPATKCPEGQRCLASGRCELVACVDGYTCKAQARCEPGRPGSDLHGCVHLTCKTDLDCPCDAYCVLGQCHAKPGVCLELHG